MAIDKIIYQAYFHLKTEMTKETLNQYFAMSMFCRTHKKNILLMFMKGANISEGHTTDYRLTVYCMLSVNDMLMYQLYIISNMYFHQKHYKHFA